MENETLSPEDRFAIQDLLGKFYWSLDTGDAEGIVAAFTPDGSMTSASGTRYENKEGLTQFAHHATSTASSLGRQHTVHPLHMFRDKDGWTQRSYLVILHWNESGDRVIRGMSYADDTVVKTPAGWRIKSRRNGSWSREAQPWTGNRPTT